MRAMKDSGIPWIGEIPVHWNVIRTKNKYDNHKDVVGDRADNFERLALTLGGVIKRSKEDSTGLQPEAFNGYQILRENELVLNSSILQMLRQVASDTLHILGLFHLLTLFYRQRKHMKANMAFTISSQCGKGKSSITWGMMA